MERGKLASDHAPSSKNRLYHKVMVISQAIWAAFCVFFWPGYMWAIITKAPRRGPQGPFTRWRNVCALMALAAAVHSPYQGPQPSIARPSARLRLSCSVYSTTANTPRTKEREKKRAKGEEVKRGMKNREIWCLRVLVAFHKGASISAPLEGKRRGGWRVGVHSSPLMAWRGTGSGCGERNEGKPKPLQTRCTQLCCVGPKVSRTANYLRASLMFGPKLWPIRVSSLFLCSSIRCVFFFFPNDLKYKNGEKKTAGECW